MLLSKLFFLIAFVLFVSNLSQGIRGSGTDEYSAVFRIIGFLCLTLGFVFMPKEEAEENE